MSKPSDWKFFFTMALLGIGTVFVAGAWVGVVFVLARWLLKLWGPA